MTGPLAGILLLARPRSARGRIWFAAALLATVSSVGIGPRTAGQDTIRAGALLFTGVMVALVAFTRMGALARATLAVALTGILLLVGGAMVGLEWSTAHLELRTQLLDAVQAFHSVARLPAIQLKDLQTAAEWMARLYPGLAALSGLAGGVLATAIAARVADRPVVAPPAPFAEFRFSDHLVWGAVATLAVALLPLQPAGVTAVGNLLVVWTGLYIARGAAVFVAFARRWPPIVRITLFLAAILLLPYAIGAALLMGLADTWLDIRRVLAPPGAGGATR